jgi:hypothetical protein
VVPLLFMSSRPRDVNMLIPIREPSKREHHEPRKAKRRIYSSRAYVDYRRTKRVHIITPRFALSRSENVRYDRS